MKVFYELNNLPAFRKAVVTIGSFDGVHAGHQEILSRVKRLARQTGGESVVVTFHPHPRDVIYPQDDRPLQLLSTIQERIRLFEQYGIDNVVVVPFTVAFSQLSADEYLEKFLLQSFRPAYIVIGYDHRFGLNRQGDIHFLRWHGEKAGFEVVEIEKQTIDDLAISSTKIRQAVANGDMQTARQLLNHYYLLSGTVVRGQNIGMSLGFPTANLDVGTRNKLIPPDGIYAIFAHHKGIRYGGMLYIGTRPTLPDHNNRTIEAHLFGFRQSIYGQDLQLELVERIRDDAAFQDLDALRQQLALDQEQSERVLRAHHWTPEEANLKTLWPAVAIVILNYNGKQHLSRFLPGVLNSTYPNLRVVVADNGSDDGSLSLLAEQYPEIECIDLGKNFGFAAGYNQALQLRKEDYLVLLNSDVEVPPGWLEPIIKQMEQDRHIAVVQPKIKALTEPHKFEYAGACGGWMDTLGYPFCRGRIFAETEEDQGQYDDVQEIFWASGAAFVIRRALFEQFGGFDGEFFAHSEEIDLCWRLKNAGYKIMVNPQSSVLHLGGGTLAYNTPRKTYLNFRNSLYTLVKNEEASKLTWLVPLRLVMDGLAAGLFLSQGKLPHITAVLRAHVSLYVHLPALLGKRRRNKQLINQYRLKPVEKLSGRYAGSIVWQYYGNHVHRFSELPVSKP